MTDSDETGMALLLTVLALVIVSIIGLYMTLNATTGIKISDNFESQLQATYAAMAGLNHAAVLLRGLAFDDVLKGPDGVYDGSPMYWAEAKSFKFRLPLPVLSAQLLDILDPTAYVLGIPDDGLINTGLFNGTLGIELIPRTGIGQFAPNPYGPGQMLISRYFVKAADNNGESSELTADPDDNPFVDGDGTIIIRSVGVSKTFADQTGSIVRRNSVVVLESRFKRFSTWDLGPALVVLGSSVNASFDGNPEIAGNQAAGIGTMDTDLGDASAPDVILHQAAGAVGTISGGGLPSPSVRDISSEIRAHPDRALLSNPAYLWDFIQNQALQMADHVYEGAQVWTRANTPFLGAYDSARPWNAPGQNPQIILVRGDLHAPDGFTGGGVLIVTGNLNCSGSISFSGLVLVIGSGNLAISGSGPGIIGGVVVASLVNSGAYTDWGIPGVAISEASRMLADRAAVKMAISLIPARRISLREISGVDP